MSDQWESKRLADAIGVDALFCDGDWIESKDQDPNGEVRLVQLADILDGEFKQKSKRFMTRSKSDELATTLLKEGDLLIARMPDPIGRACIFPGSDQDCVSIVDVAIVRPTQCDPKWLMYYLNSQSVRAEIEERATGSTRKRISRSALAEILIQVPPLPEQKKIAEMLSGIDLQIKNYQNKSSKYEHLRQGIIDLTMTHGTRGGKVIDTEAGKVPDNWRVGRVEDFFVLGRGRVISIPYIKDHPGAYPVFSSQSKNNGEMGRMDTYDFDGDYFTWTTDGAYAGSVFARSGKFNCTNVCGTGKAKSPDEANTRFAAYFLQRVAKKHVSYVGNPKLMNNAFAEIPFALPPIEEQNEIVSIIDSARRDIDLIDKQIGALSNLKNSISAELISGRKRVCI